MTLTLKLTLTLTLTLKLTLILSTYCDSQLICGALSAVGLYGVRGPHQSEALKVQPDKAHVVGALVDDVVGCRCLGEGRWEAGVLDVGTVLANTRAGGGHSEEAAHAKPEKEQ